MTRPATTDQEGERIPQEGGKRRTAQEVQEALDAIPIDSVTARTAGALRVSGSCYTIAEECVSFERAVAEENAGATVPRTCLSFGDSLDVDRTSN